ncbi:MAG: hypothetical protein JWQ02_319 [Capsulimonas sp.]|nr:hypothetical protein [Capsulimonas sp.]
MNKAFPTLILLTCASVLAPAAHAVTVAEARQGITAAINKRLAARHHRDAAAYLSTFAPTWTMTNVSGATQTYAAMRKTMIKRLATLPISEMYKIHWRMTKVTVSGNQAHATLIAQYELPVRHTPRGPVHVYVDTVSDSVWGRTPAGWTQRSEQYLYDAKAFSRRALVRIGLY